MFSVLGTTFAEVLKNEWLGIVASAFVLVSFLFSKQTITRIINICGCIAFVIYGLLLPAYSTAFMNGALIIVHIVFLVKDYLARKKAKRAQTLPDEQSTETSKPTAIDGAQQPTADERTDEQTKNRAD